MDGKLLHVSAGGIEMYMTKLEIRMTNGKKPTGGPGPGIRFFVTRMRS
jgi:hypothetical protein